MNWNKLKTHTYFICILVTFCLHLQICCWEGSKNECLLKTCCIKRALLDRFVSLSEYHIIWPTGRCRMDSVTEWLDIKHFGGERNQKSPACIPGYGEEDSWKHFWCSLKGWQVWICSWSNGHVIIMHALLDMFTVGQFRKSAAILYNALNAGHVCLVVLLDLEAFTDSAISGTGRKTPFLLDHQALKSTLGWGFDVEICLKWRPLYELIVKVCRDP